MTAEDANASPNAGARSDWGGKKPRPLHLLLKQGPHTTCQDRPRSPQALGDFSSHAPVGLSPGLPRSKKEVSLPGSLDAGGMGTITSITCGRDWELWRGVGGWQSSHHLGQPSSAQSQPHSPGTRGHPLLTPWHWVSPGLAQATVTRSARKLLLTLREGLREQGGRDCDVGEF